MNCDSLLVIINFFFSDEDMTETSTTVLEKDRQNEELSSSNKMIEKSKNIDKSEECPTCDCICPNPKNLFTKQDLKNNEIVATNNNNRGGPGSNPPPNSFESSWTARPLIHQQNSNDQLIQRTFDDSKASFSLYQRFRLINLGN